MRQHTTNQTGGERRSRRLHPAWLILIACCFLQAGGMGTINNAAGIMVPAVLGDLQFSQGSFMLYFTIQGLCMTAALPVAGKLLPKVSMRVLVSVGMVAAALAFASMGQFNAVWQWYVAGAVLGVAAAFRVPAAGTRHDRQLVQEEGGPCDGHRHGLLGASAGR